MGYTKTAAGAASGAAAGTAVLPGWGTAIGGVLGAGAGLYGDISDNEAKDKADKIAAADYAQSVMERQAERERLMKMQKLADLYSHSSWVQDMDKDRVDQNYGYYLKNLMG